MYTHLVKDLRDNQLKKGEGSYGMTEIMISKRLEVKKYIFKIVEV